MSVSNGNDATSTVFNNAFVSKTTNSSMAGQLSLANTATESGATVSNIQRELNSIASFMGKATNQAASASPTWTTSAVGASANDLFDRVDAISQRFPLTFSSFDNESLNSGQVLFGKVEQSGKLYFDSASGYLGLNMGGLESPDAAIDIRGFLGFRHETIASSGVFVSTSQSTLQQFTAASGVAGFSPRLESSNFIIALNKSASPIVVVNNSGSASVGHKILTGTGGDTSIAVNAAAIFIKDQSSASGYFHMMGGGGGGAGGGLMTQNTFSSATITCTTDARQSWRSTASAAFSVTSFNVSALTGGEEIEVVSSSDTNTVSIAYNATAVKYQNGNWSGGQWNSIRYAYSTAASGMREISRS